MDREQLIKAIEQMPEPLLEEVYDFVSYLKAKVARERMETALASESSLEKDWLLPEEDSAWRDL
jgi:hypothetical protein